MLTRRLELFKPFSVFTMAVRNNCPWHRSNYKPNYFPFYLKKKVKETSLEARTKTPGGRIILMRNVLLEKPCLSWNYNTKTPEKRLSYPL